MVGLVCIQLEISTGKNATLLIHEATLEDGMEKEAVEKTHRWGAWSGSLATNGVLLPPAKVGRVVWRGLRLL